jgi:DNA gyrase/topoisomerase IV subunit B
LRGKIINCLSNNDEDIFANDEIKLLLSALNITPGSYNNKKLRYGKVAIASDGDADGSHIGLLVMAALRYLAPEFLNEGRLCWLRTPLYIVKNGKKARCAAKCNVIKVWGVLAHNKRMIQCSHRNINDWISYNLIILLFNCLKN